MAIGVRDCKQRRRGGATLVRGRRARYIARMNDFTPAPTGTPAGVSAARTAPIEILVAPHPSLRRKARPVRPEDAAMLRDLLPRMYESMYLAPGIGLAGPQVGVDLRVAIVDLMRDEVRAPITLINPEIIRSSAQLAPREEGCLSLPGQYAEVVRPDAVRVRFQDLDGRRRELDADGLLATCLQHELDHLDGVLFVDHLSTLKRNMIMRRLAKELKTKAGQAGG